MKGIVAVLLFAQSLVGFANTKIILNSPVDIFIKLKEKPVSTSTICERIAMNSVNIIESLQGRDLTDRMERNTTQIRYVNFLVGQTRNWNLEGSDDLVIRNDAIRYATKVMVYRTFLARDKSSVLDYMWDHSHDMFIKYQNEVVALFIETYEGCNERMPRWLRAFKSTEFIDEPYVEATKW